ncbi:MAG: GNAT family N-acetyltransferase [Streptosporangiaceae bacterium]
MTRPAADIMVRLAEPAEYAAIGDLTARVYVEEGFSAPDSPYLTELRDAAGRAGSCDLLVVRDGDALAGTVTFCVGGTPYAEVAGPGEAGFRMLAVARSARGRGVGQALVRACLDRAWASGARTVRLSTKLEMRAAHRLYERLGFRRTPQLDWSPVPGTDLLVYSLEKGD